MTGVVLGHIYNYGLSLIGRQVNLKNFQLSTEAIVILLVLVLSNAPLLTRLWEIAEGFTNRSVNKGTALT